MTHEPSLIVDRMIFTCEPLSHEGSTWYLIDSVALLELIRKYLTGYQLRCGSGIFITDDLDDAHLMLHIMTDLARQERVTFNAVKHKDLWELRLEPVMKAKVDLTKKREVENG